MVINYNKTELLFKLSLGEKVFSLHGDFSIPNKNIVEIKNGRPPLWIVWWDVRLPGTFFPGLARLGTYYTKRGKEFWLWIRCKKFEYTIELKNEKYDRLVISCNTKISGGDDK